MTEGQPVSREALVDELVTDVGALKNQDDVAAALRRFKRRETLRIAYGDIVRGQPVATVTRQISYLADAIVEGALDFARRHCRGAIRSAAAAATAEPCRFVVLALGKLGGLELNYSSDIDLMFLYEQDGQTDARRTVTNDEFFDRLARELIRLLTEPTDLGVAYRVDMRLRPDGSARPAGLELREHARSTTTPAAAPGSGRRTSRPGRSPATSSWAAICSNSSSPGFTAAT